MGLLEGVAVVDATAAEAAAKPFLALSAGAVRERFLIHVATNPTLDRVVADRVGGVERLLDVAGLDELARTVRVMRPDASVTVGLQLHPHL